MIWWTLIIWQDLLELSEKFDVLDVFEDWTQIFWYIMKHIILELLAFRMKWQIIQMYVRKERVNFRMKAKAFFK